MKEILKLFRNVILINIVILSMLHFNISLIFEIRLLVNFQPDWPTLIFWLIACSINNTALALAIVPELLGGKRQAEPIDTLKSMVANLVEGQKDSQELHEINLKMHTWKAQDIGQLKKDVKRLEQ